MLDLSNLAGSTRNCELQIIQLSVRKKTGYRSLTTEPDMWEIEMKFGPEIEVNAETFDKLVDAGLVVPTCCCFFKTLPLDLNAPKLPLAKQELPRDAWYAYGDEQFDENDNPTDLIRCWLIDWKE